MFQSTFTNPRLSRSLVAKAAGVVASLLVGGVLLIGVRWGWAAEAEAEKPAATPSAAEPAAPNDAAAKPPANEPAPAGQPASDGEKPAAAEKPPEQASDKPAQEKPVAEPAKPKKRRVSPAQKQRADMLTQQLRPALAIELTFVRHMCPELTPPQRVVVKKAADQALADVVTNLSEIPRPASNSRMSVPQPSIRQAVSDALREVLPTDQWEHFAAEADARIKRRQDTAILLVIEHLDEALYLTAEQREQISRSLNDRWQHAWEGWLQLRNSPGFIPALPADIVLPHLDADQKKTWQTTAKIALQPNWAGGGMMVDNGEVANDWWDEAAEKNKDADVDGRQGDRRVEPAPR